jgi:cell shape-determining protein MreD
VILKVSFQTSILKWIEFRVQVLVKVIALANILALIYYFQIKVKYIAVSKSICCITIFIQNQ